MSARTFQEEGRVLVLLDRGTHHELSFDGVPILSSAALGTERAFGRLSSELARATPRVLIGGLGFGATLAGALEALPAHAEVIVVERLETVIALVRGELAHHSEGALDDPRVTLVRDDVAEVIARERALGCILLDTDNGPDWASFPENARLYSASGLLSARAALAPGGSLAVWSGYPAEPFQRRLRGAGLSPRVVPFEEHGRLQARAYVGRRAPARV